MLSFPFKRYLYGYISNNRQTVIIHSLVYYYFPLLKIQSDIFDPHNQFHLITYFSDIQTFFLGYSKDFPNNLLNFILSPPDFIFLLKILVGKEGL